MKRAGWLVLEEWSALLHSGVRVRTEDTGQKSMEGTDDVGLGAELGTILLIRFT